MEKPTGENKRTEKVIKSSYWKFVGGIFGIVLVVVGGLAALGFYERWRDEKALQNYLEGLKQFREEDYQRAMADTYGGKTPHETLRMYIEAVEKGDYELASKYFIGDRQEKWREELNRIAGFNKINQFLTPLKEAVKMQGEYSEAKNTFSIHEPILVSFKVYPNGIWKIIEI